MWEPFSGTNSVPFQSNCHFLVLPTLSGKLLGIKMNSLHSGCCLGIVFVHQSHTPDFVSCLQNARNINSNFLLFWLNFHSMVPVCVTSGGLGKCHLWNVRSALGRNEKLVRGVCGGPVPGSCILLGTNLMIRFELRRIFSLTWGHFEGKREGEGVHTSLKAGTWFAL